MLSRYWALWGIVEVAPEAVKTGALKLFTIGDVTLQLNLISLLFCWSVTEILRYGFYAAKVTHPTSLPAQPAMCTCSADTNTSQDLEERPVDPVARCSCLSKTISHPKEQGWSCPS